MKLSTTLVKFLCLGFASAFILSCGPAPTNGPFDLDVSGKWRWISSSYVTSSNTAGISCPAPQSVTMSRVDTVTVTDTSGAVTIQGFLGLSTNKLKGTLAAGTYGSLAELDLQGNYPQSSGTWVVDSNSVVSVQTDTSMTGEESWIWTATTGGATCKGNAQIDAVKL